MSNWHARTGDQDGNSFEILYHVPIPSADNRVNVNYRSALIGSGIGGSTRMTEGVGAGLITTAEKANITSGAILEVSQIITTNPGETAGQLQTRIDANFTALANTSGPFITALKHRLDYWGKDRDVP